MKRIAVFVEGDSESIFLFYLLQIIFPVGKISITCHKVATDNNFLSTSPSLKSPDPSLTFLILSAQNDTKVISMLRTRAIGMLDQGFDAICGLRDIYSDEYHKQAKGKIDPSLITKFVHIWQQTIHQDPKVHLFLSQMEFEAWYFVFYDILERMGLRSMDIDLCLGMKLKAIDPENSFYHPKRQLRELYEKIIKRTFHERHFAELFSKQIHDEDVLYVLESGKIQRFVAFYKYLSSL